MPEAAHRRPGLLWKLVVAFVAGAAVSGIVVAIVVSRSSTAPSGHGGNGAIDMSSATGIDCGSPVPPGQGHPVTLLSQIFTVSSGTKTYTLGWQIVPYRGPGRTYTFGQGGNLLALEPHTGGRPLGYGKGTVTYGPTATGGTIDATVTLKAGGTVPVSGAWSCVASVPSTTAAGAPRP